ncbi:MAG: AIR synthase related protein [bacterium]|nr:AIR synthase related protein [bacterium]
MDQVNYSTLDTAKNAFIAASRKTLGFAKQYGFVPGNRLGASANVFSLDLKPFLKKKQNQLSITLLPEGLGTADDARPDDLSEKELVEFWTNIGIKTLSVTTNDAAASGMQTVLLSLYLPSADPEQVFTPAFMKGFLKGIVDGCKQVGCVYFSGETPQLKNKIVQGKLDIAGALFGLMAPGMEPTDGSKLAAGNFMVLVESNGPNENGFTALRELSTKLPKGYRSKLPSGQQYWQAINNRSHLYTPVIQSILKAGIQPTNIEPITGHGWQKIMRSAKPLRYVVEQMLPVPEVFQFVQEHSGATAKEMIRIFNYGTGLVIFTQSESDAKQVVQMVQKAKMKAVIAGRVEAAKERQVVVQPLGCTLKSKHFLLRQ